MHKIIIFLIFFLINSHASADATLDEQLVYRAAFGSAEDIRILLERGANPDAANNANQSVMTIAASRNDNNALPMLQYLAEKGAKPSSSTADTENTFITAIENGTAESVGYLLKWNPPYTMVNNFGDDLITIAKRRGDEQIVALVENLKQAQITEYGRLTGEENRRELFKDFSSQICTLSYMKFYYTQEHQAEPDLQKYGEIKQRLANEIHETLSSLNQYFSMQRKDLIKLEEYSSETIIKELFGLGTADYRVRVGVGTNADLQKRCGKIATEISSRAAIKRK